MHRVSSSCSCHVEKRRELAEFIPGSSGVFVIMVAWPEKRKRRTELVAESGQPAITRGAHSVR